MPTRTFLVVVVVVATEGSGSSGSRKYLKTMTHVECSHCGYEWDYSGELQFATCPSCRTKTAVEDDPEDAMNQTAET